MLNKRKEGRLARKRLSAEERSLFSGKICDKIQNYITDKSVIMLYNSIDCEVDVSFLLKNPNKTFVYPRVLGDNIIPVCSNSFEKGAYGIDEPVGKAFEGVIDAVIVPMTAFDEFGNRLGFGKGFYDRFLKEKDCLKIGIAFSCQKTSDITVKSTDIKMDYIITENEVLECEK